MIHTLSTYTHTHTVHSGCTVQPPHEETCVGALLCTFHCLEPCCKTPTMQGNGLAHFPAWMRGKQAQTCLHEEPTPLLRHVQCVHHGHRRHHHVHVEVYVPWKRRGVLGVCIQGFLTRTLVLWVHTTNDDCVLQGHARLSPVQMLLVAAPPHVFPTLPPHVFALLLAR